MASKVQAHHVEAALLDLLPARLSTSYGMSVDVRTISVKDDFSESGQLVMKSPACRIHFDSASYGEARDTTRTTLSAELLFSVFCMHQSLRSQGDARTKTLALVAAVQDELAGARLKLADGHYTEPIMIRAINQAEDVAGPIEQCYAISFVVPGIAQFSGINANFGAKA